MPSAAAPLRSSPSSLSPGTHLTRRTMSADQLVTYLFNVGVAVSIIATVLALGMSYSVAELVAPLRRVWLVALMVFVNSLLVPAVAWGIAKALPIDDGVAGMT